MTESRPSNLAARTLLFVLLVALLHVFWWHVAFTFVLLSRGDPLDSQLYLEYVGKFLVGPGLEIPTFIQFTAFVLTALTAIGTVAVRAVARRLRA